MEVYKVEKPASTETVQAITELMMEQMNSLSGGTTEESLLHTVQLVLNPESQAEFFVAEENRQLVGCAFLNKGIGLDKGGAYVWLNDLYVKKEFRRKGIARKILLKVLYWAEHHEFKGIELETGVNNAATKRLYNSLGFYDIVSKRYGRTLT
ncbi:GNAT family N-acetyltransferase [Salipaludibacillus keqinensis]|uniref:GNAT family N-acetyltransferase n=1 Tax=Salipaludibacillus keqinensis TaxID=2045207 RepID=A0A323TGY4_9BACI|nr:GNAT family N-acetyltransferase [Salipaludibacillus keqinensis]PYZ93546.1 GNAT family N-acetyltransferase [Salipaludibacillus keqinensis]